jgi:hypoxia up-regulated 1
MAPPGRRRSVLSLSVVLCFLLFSQSALAISAVLGVDLGTEYIKAVLVKPGTPLEIVLSKDSKRKDTSIVAFKTPKVPVAAESYPERFYGSAAEALAPRFPGDVYPNLKQLLGLPAEGSTVVAEYKSRYPSLRLVQSDTRSAVAFKSPSFSRDDRAFAVEELLATVLRSVKSNAQTLAGASHKVEAVVFTIPPFYTIEEKSALELAADLAGLKVMGVVTDGVAVGINYATSRTFESINDGAKPEYHMVFDVGAGYTTSTVLKIQGRTIKDVGKFNKTIQEVIVIGTGWDRTLGGDALNQAIVRDMASRFIETPAGGKLGKSAQDVLSSGRAVARMRKDAQRLRQVLSANQESSASFEELYEDVDFKYKLSRADYESLTTSFAERLDAPFKAALRAANLSAADLDSVILHGGAIRTPFVQKRLEILAGDASKLRSNVNSDEAAAFGAAFKAARLSPSFRVKDIRDYDAAIYPTWMQYQKGKDGKTSQQKIFSASSYTGSTKVVTLPKLDDFEIYLFQKRPTDPGSPYEAGDKGSTGTRFQSQNLTDSVAKLVKDKGCKKEEITTQITVRLDPVWGRPEVVSGSVSCEAEVVEKKGVLGDMKDFLGLGKKDEKVLKEESTTSSGSASSESSASTSSGTASGESAEASSKPKDDTKEPPKPKPKKMKTETVKFEFDAQHDRIAVIPYPEHKFMAERLVYSLRCG